MGMRGKLVYGKYLMEHNHPFNPIENSMHILDTASKGRLLNTIENFYIHRETGANNQLNEKMTTKPNIIFDVILRHTQPCDVTHNTMNRSPSKP
jgi:hypothetical protein